MVKQLSNPVLILTGFSGAGKDTIAEALRAKGYHSVIPHSTRPMRDGECEGNPYNFITHDKFYSMIDSNQFAEHNNYTTMFNGVSEQQYYGTSYTALEAFSNTVLTCGVQSSIALKDNLEGSATLVFITVPDDVREERARVRGSFDKVEWDNRMTQDRAFRKQTNIDELSDIQVSNVGIIDEVVTAILKQLPNKGN